MKSVREERQIMLDLVVKATDKIDWHIQHGFELSPPGYEAGYAFGVAASVYKKCFRYLEGGSPAFAKLPFTIQLALFVRIINDAAGRTPDKDLAKNISQIKVMERAYAEILAELQEAAE